MGLSCVHCGEDCGKNPVMWNDKAFCCEGCKTVYQILNQNKLYSYYDLSDSPGIKVEIKEHNNKYAFLDKEEIQQKLYDFREGGIAKITFYIPSIHCASCIWLLENLNKLDKGIKNSSVHFVKKEVSVTFNEAEMSLRKLAELLDSIHYIPQITLDRLEKQSSDSNNKKLLYRIGVAGIAFGNTMLFSFPEYFGSQESYQYIFGYLNLLFGIPVFFYSGGEYLISAIKNLRKRIVNIDLPVALGMTAIFTRSVYEILTHSGAGYIDSLTGFIFFLLIGKWYQNKTYRALSFERNYKSYFPVAATVIEENEEKSVLLEQLKPGNKILVRNKELIPADSRLLKGDARIDYSFVTGESTPVIKKEGDQIFAGGRQIGEALELEISTEVQQSRLTTLWNQSESKQEEIEKLKNITDTLSRYFTLVIVVLAVLAGPALHFSDIPLAVKILTSVLIVACPCALALAVPFAMGNTMRLFGRKKFYLKKSEVVERLAYVDTIVFDKTGTITLAEAMQAVYSGDALSPDERICIKSMTRQSTHPLSAAVFELLKNESIAEVSEFREITSSGIVGHCLGRKIKLGSGEFTAAEKNENIDGSAVYISIDDKVKGYFTIANRYRPQLEEVVAKLSEKYELHVISGDNEKEKQRLSAIFPDENRLHFNLLPAEKANYIKKLKSSGKNVLMLGDGLNDAGALLEAHVGISVADSVYHFSPACDAVLEAGTFELLPDFLKISKKSVRIVYISFAISVVYNIIGLAYAVQGLLSPIIAAILMPASSVSVVGFVTAATGIAGKRISALFVPAQKENRNTLKM